MKTLVEFLTEYNKKEGYGTEVDDLHESLIECFEEVWKGNCDEHRWYNVYDVIFKVVIEEEERYFQTFIYETKGDGNADDYGLDKPTVNNTIEVYPHTVSTTVYKSKPQGYEI